MGEIHMLAVDPDHQGSGIGTALTKFALARIKDAGMAVAMVETGATQGTPQRAARTRRPATSRTPAHSQILQEPVATWAAMPWRTRPPGFASRTGSLHILLLTAPTKSTPCPTYEDYLQFGLPAFLPLMQNSTSFVRSSALK